MSENREASSDLKDSFIVTPPALPIACREIMNWQPLWGLPALPGPGICGSMLRGTVENHQDHGILLRAFKLAATCMRIQCGTALSAIRNKGKPLRRGVEGQCVPGLGRAKERIS